MTKEMYFNKVILQKRMSLYRDKLLADFDMHDDYLKMVDSLFFPVKGIKQRIPHLQINNFYDIAYLKYTDRPCTLEELDDLSIPSDEAVYLPADNYFFSERKLNSPDDFLQTSYPFYIFHEDFVNRADNFFFEILKDCNGYLCKSKKCNVLSKKIDDNVYFNFDIRRRDFHFSTISDYQFPDFSIQINSDKFHISNATDLKTFLFLPTSGFYFFHSNSHTFIKNDEGKIVKVERNPKEPVIFQNRDDNSFYVANPEQSRRNYTKYILSIMFLLSHYLNVFEKWFKEDILPVLDELENFKE